MGVNYGKVGGTMFVLLCSTNQSCLVVFENRVGDK